jgi:hypothetical protein
MPTKKRTGSLQNRYKKQHGLHHKQSDKYLKVYWPYIPVLMLVIVGISASVILLVNKPGTSIVSSNISAPTLLTKTNQIRKSSNLQPLTVNSQLSTAAQEKANDMAVQNYWSPVSPEGQTPWQVIRSTGYQYTLAGENLAYGFSNSSSLFSAWLNSPSHKENIENSNFSDVGFGIAKAPNFRGQGPETIVVALYGTTNTTTPVSSDSSQTFTTASITQPKSEAVVRAQLYSSQSRTLTIFISGITVGIIGCFLIIRHGLILKKWALESEELIIKHPILDVLLVIFIVGLSILGQTVGFIS